MIKDSEANGGGRQYRLLSFLFLLFSQQIKKLQSFKGDPDKLTLVDSFMYLLIQVPR